MFQFRTPLPEKTAGSAQASTRASAQASGERDNTESHASSKKHLISMSPGEKIESFFKKHICKYENHAELPLNVVGSIGYHFMHLLHQVAEKNNVTLGKVIKSPISGLVKHHMDN